MTKTPIEWTQESWNPIVGCTVLSPGCTNCYAMSMAARIEAMNAEARERGKGPSAPQYDGTTQYVNGNAVWTGKVALAEHTLLQPLKRKKPTLYFVNSMGDPFHEAVPDEWIDTSFAVMALTPQHTYQALTKRAERMRRYFADPLRHNSIELAAEKIVRGPEHLGGKHVLPRLPLPNVWLGVSTERQKEADERIPHLLATPAAVRFISAEPLLGPIDLTRIDQQIVCTNPNATIWTDALRGLSHSNDPIAAKDEPFKHDGLDWVIVGGESGPGSRPMHPDWARSLRDQCLAAGAPFFFKQWGNWYPYVDRDRDDPQWHEGYVYALARDVPEKYRLLDLGGNRLARGDRVHLMQRYGKKGAGRLLDGVTHDAMPGIFNGDHRITPPAKRLEHA